VPQRLSFVDQACAPVQYDAACMQNNISRTSHVEVRHGESYDEGDQQNPRSQRYLLRLLGRRAAWCACINVRRVWGEQPRRCWEAVLGEVVKGCKAPPDSLANKIKLRLDVFLNFWWGGSVRDGLAFTTSPASGVLDVRLASGQFVAA
jgi:hypothetical protein